MAALVRRKGPAKTIGSDLMGECLKRSFVVF
jgi:hypothetical protein